MKLSDLIGQKLLSVTEPWETDLEKDQVRLVFEGGTLMVSAIGDSWLHGASIYLKTTGKVGGDETT